MFAGDQYKLDAAGDAGDNEITESEE